MMRADLPSPSGSTAEEGAHARCTLVSVILCTYNRAASLGHTLRTLAAQSLPWSDYEVLVIDNCSTDGTAGVVQAVQMEYPGCRIHLLFEERQGLPYARNTGLGRAKGRYVAFTDDDVLLPADWLREALAAFAKVRPEPHGVGGRVLPRYEVDKPDWFKDEYETDSLGEMERYLKPGESFTGSNMFFRSELLAALNGFEPELGMAGDWIGVAEETYLYERIWRADAEARLYYHPALHVLHEVPTYRMRLGYIAKRLFVTGQAWQIRHGRRSPVGRLLGIGGAIGVIARGVVRAIAGVGRHTRWQQWVVEDAREVFAGLGRASASLGIYPRLRERPRGAGERG